MRGSVILSLTTPIKDFKTKLLAMSQEYDLKRCLRKEADLCYFCVINYKTRKTPYFYQDLIYIKSSLFAKLQQHLQYGSFRDHLKTQINSLYEYIGNCHFRSRFKIDYNSDFSQFVICD